MKKTSQTLPYGLIFSVLFFSLPMLAREKAASKSNYIAYVGTYTTSGDWRGETTSKGIYSFRYDAKTGELTAVELAVEALDPSFVAVHPNGKYLYAVNEIGKTAGEKSGTLSAYSIHAKSGKLTRLNTVASGGSGPCYLSFDKTGHYVFAANYNGGSVSVHPIALDGRLMPATSVVSHQGSGPDKERQEGPHAHWIGVSPDNRFVLVADLGLDEVRIYRFDVKKGSLNPNDPAFVRVEPGTGPRHVAFHPNGPFAYLVTEMGAEVTAFAYNAQQGALAPLQTISTLPEDYTGPKEDAELAVHPNGKFLYVSNRGHDSIAIFAIDPAKGTLTSLGTVSTQGKTPRFFTIDPAGENLLVANQISHTIVVFKIDPATGQLTPTGKPVEVQAPTSIAFVPAP